MSELKEILEMFSDRALEIIQFEAADHAVFSMEDIETIRAALTALKEEQLKPARTLIRRTEMSGRNVVIVAAHLWDSLIFADQPVEKLDEAFRVKSGRHRVDWLIEYGVQLEQGARNWENLTKGMRDD